MKKRDLAMILVGVSAGVLMCFIALPSAAFFLVSDVNWTPASTAIDETPDSDIATPAPKNTITPLPTRFIATRTPRPTPTPEYGTVRNPVPVGQELSLVRNGYMEFKVSVEDVVAGEDAWSEIASANMFNEPPPEGMQYVLVDVFVSHYGDDDGVLEMSYLDWKSVSNNRYFDYFDVNVCCIINDLDIKLGSGGEAAGILVQLVFLDDENPLLVLDDKFYFEIYP